MLLSVIISHPSHLTPADQRQTTSMCPCWVTDSGDGGVFFCVIVQLLLSLHQVCYDTVPACETPLLSNVGGPALLRWPFTYFLKLFSSTAESFPESLLQKTVNEKYSDNSLKRSKTAVLKILI